MTLEYLRNSLNTWGKSTKYPRVYTLLEDGRHRVQWTDSKGNTAQSIYIDKEPDGTPIKCYICNIPCLTEAVKYQRQDGDKKRHTCTRSCQNQLTGPTKWNPLYIERDDNGWFKCNYTGYMVRRYRPVIGKPRIKEFYHRYVMEQHLGRKLLPTEFVHHINMDKLNNNIDNLYICNHIEHLESHHSINPVVTELYNKGLLGFNRQIGRYYAKLSGKT